MLQGCFSSSVVKNNFDLTLSHSESNNGLGLASPSHWYFPVLDWHLPIAGYATRPPEDLAGLFLTGCIGWARSDRRLCSGFVSPASPVSAEPLLLWQDSAVREWLRWFRQKLPWAMPNPDVAAAGLNPQICFFFFSPLRVLLIYRFPNVLFTNGVLF